MAGATQQGKTEEVKEARQSYLAGFFVRIHRMHATLYFEVKDNTSFIASRLVDMVRYNHKLVMGEIASLARTKCPVDTTALRESIYVVGPWGSGYSQAVAKAAASPGTRITERDQIGPPLVLTDVRAQRGVWLAAIDIPLAYAIFVHNGYYHILAERVIPPNPFLLDAFLEVWNSNRFLTLCQADFQRILAH